MKKLIGVKELAKSIGVSPSTVTYYTNLGLFVVDKIKGNKRLYDSELTTRRFNDIQKARQEGYSLMLIKRKISEKDIIKEG